MEPAEIVAIANSLQLDAERSVLDFARLVAEHCAQLAEETLGGAGAAQTIRAAFHLAQVTDAASLN
jgi:hypothetical protein